MMYYNIRRRELAAALGDVPGLRSPGDGAGAPVQYNVNICHTIKSCNMT